MLKLNAVFEKECYNQRINFYIDEDEVLTKQQKKILDDWIIKNLKPHRSKSYNYRHTSYGLKHLVENSIGFYVSNADMKVALAKAGFKAYFRPNKGNAYYQISEGFYKRYSKIILYPRTNETGF